MKIRFSPGAAAYLKAEASYLKERSLPAALRLSDDLKRLRRNLTHFPRIGKAADDLPIEGVLRFVMGDYLVDYQLEADLIRVLKIRHGRQSASKIADDGEVDFEDTGPDI